MLLLKIGGKELTHVFRCTGSQNQQGQDSCRNQNFTEKPPGWTGFGRYGSSLFPGADSAEDILILGLSDHIQQVMVCHIKSSISSLDRSFSRVR